MKFDFKSWGGYLIAAGFLCVIVASFIFIYQQGTKIEILNERIEIVDENMTKREEFLLYLERRISSQSVEEETKVIYILYARNIIDNHYRVFGVPQHEQMTDAQIADFLEQIFLYAKTLPIPIEEGLFLPLAYASVETHFCPGRVGGDGERSLFQFMDDTAKQTYERNGKSYNPNFWNRAEEYVWLWFAHYGDIVRYFDSPNTERKIRFTAIAYNAGLYRNELRLAFNENWTIEQYLNKHPLKKGIASYNEDIYTRFIQYKEDFTL